MTIRITEDPPYRFLCKECGHTIDLHWEAAIDPECCDAPMTLQYATHYEPPCGDFPGELTWEDA